MKILFILLIIEVFSLSRLNAQTTELIADNGVLKVKLDLTRGGAISYISLSGSNLNLVNIHDNGRYIQQSYYAGKRVDRRAEGQNPAWSPFPWNPVQAGDSYGNRSKVLDYQQNGDTLYVKSIPMLWDMNNMPAEAEIEQWTILKGNIIEVHNKLTCHRTGNIYGDNILHIQELPAVYLISALSNLYTYSGDVPFTNDILDKSAVVNLSSGGWGQYPTVSEHWMAFVNNNKWGVGIYNPNSTYFSAGMAGNPGGEAHDGSTSYISANRWETLNKNSVFEYDYYIIVGTVEEIRAKVYQLNVKNYHPQIERWEFNDDNNFEGWGLSHSLSGKVANGYLNLQITGIDPYMENYNSLLDALKINTLDIKMKNNTTDNQAAFFFIRSDSVLYHMIGFNIVPNDTVYRDYLIKLDSNVGWKGTVVRVRLDPAQNVSTGSISIDYIRLENDISTNVAVNKYMPFKYVLSQNYPDPFNPTTTINYKVAKVGLVTLNVYDMLGQRVATLVNKVQNTGKYSINFDASRLASGVYMYRINAGNFSATKKLVLLK